ncbi:DHH family phosphoesterase [Thermanaeromonas sp. C210]|uniref:DHH family phosphoesterase n=1 Tax=Thermanaeromonas sp. C210 TaxID=2731925 RepID=UPI00155CD56C|nr:bifunctional oligoribonuclease/PAP phosphatase NrnA [Thermanaeromonas sp. C210]GFN23840.1 phosphoesterase RecJ-like protein [Thermanaeromonas sp. C210]
MNLVAAIAEELAGAREVAIASHGLPDGDCIGSTLALAAALRRQGAAVTTIIGDPVPPMYRFLPGSEEVVLPHEIAALPPLLVVVDCTDLERVREGFGERRREVQRIINIDHHVSNSFFGDLNLVDPGAAATGELVYGILKEMGTAVDAPIATALYTALVTDTGSFQYENCRADTLRMAAELMDLGADMQLIREFLWESKPLLSLRLLAHVLSTLSLACGGKVAWVVIRQEVMVRLGAGPEHVEGLVNYPRSVAGVEVGLAFRELEDGMIKVALRSKKQVDVNEIAGLFGGGGHKRAAGCTIPGPLEAAVEKVVKAVEARLDCDGGLY